MCCPHAHYTCAECFDAHVRNEAGKDLALLAKCDGRILCPRNTAANTDADRCDAPHFPDKDIAAAVSNDTFEAYLDARSKLRERQVAEEMEAQMEARLQLERERAKRGAGKEEKLRVAKEHVIEHILTLACPRCKQAFVDFDGCFALKCSRCAAAFCAYCLADCGRDAHQHVGTCPEGQASVKAAKKQKGVGGRAIGNMPATVYGTKDAFDVAQKRRRCRYLALYLEKFDDEGQRELVDALASELKDLDIAEKDVRHWQKKEAKAMRDRAVAQSNAAARQAPRPPPPARGRRGGAGAARGLLDQVVNAAFGRDVENGIFDAIFGHRPPPPGAGVPGAGAHAANAPGGGVGFVPPAPRGGARRRRDHALREHIRHIPAMNDDEFEDLLAAGFFDQPPPPGGPPGLRGRAAGPAPGELPEGVIGPIRRARMERKKREAEERARAPPVVVDLSGRRASGGGASGGASGGAVTVTVDLVTGEETRSPGSPATRRNRASRRSGGGVAAGSEAAVVDLT